MKSQSMSVTPVTDGLGNGEGCLGLTLAPSHGLSPCFAKVIWSKSYVDDARTFVRHCTRHQPWFSVFCPSKFLGARNPKNR